MITKRTVVNQREITNNGVIQIRLRKELVEDGTVISFEYHRTCIEPGVDPDAQMRFVNEHLKSMGYPAVDEDGMDSIRRIVKVEHKPEVIRAWRDLQAAQTGLIRALAR